MKTLVESKFDAYYAQQSKHLKLKGLQPKTIEAYAAIESNLGGIRDFYYVIAHPPIRKS